MKILLLLQEGSHGATDLSEKLGVSKQITHRYLKELVESEFISKHGSAPHTVYELNSNKPFSRVRADFEYTKEYIFPFFEKKYTSLKLPADTIEPHDLTFMIEASAVYSSNIEGVSIDINSFANRTKLVSRGIKKEIEEVENLLEAYDFARNHALTENNTRKAHALLSRSLLSLSRQGAYRNERMGIFGSEGLVYVATEEMFLVNEMKKFFEIIGKLRKKNMRMWEIVLWASWIHLTFALIHPFLDGNGRMARLLEKWFIVEKTRNISLWSLQTEKYYFENREKYYNVLKLGAHYWDIDMRKSKSFFELFFSFFK